MNKKKYPILVATLAVMLGGQAGPLGVIHSEGALSPSAAGSGTSATASTASKASTASSNHAQTIYNSALPLLSSSFKLPQAIQYLNANLYAVGSYRATIMVLKLENLHKAALPSWENKFSNSNIQRKLTASYKEGVSMAKLAEETQDPSLRLLLRTAGENGYKLETAEGTFFPVIDYAAYRKYKLYVTNDISDYISIMAVESDLPPAKDNGLIISWTDVSARALSMEQFTQNSPRSNRITAVKSLYSTYLTNTFYGLNNTPLFHYDNLEMDLEARKAYSGILGKNKGNSPFLEKLDGFMKLLKEKDYKLDDEVEQYRDEAAKEVTKEVTKETIKETPKETPKESPKESPKETPLP